MNENVVKSNFLLFLAAVIWGFAFVAQRKGMEDIGPFLFNSLRFAMGSLVLIPFLIKSKRSDHIYLINTRDKKFYIHGVFAGLLLYLGSATQQVGLVYTTAGKAGFITGLYMVFVPVLGMFIGQKTSISTWIGVFIAAVGLYLLSISENFTMQFGDFLVLICAIIWAVQVLFIGKISPKINSIQLSFFQFVVCALLNFITTIFYEQIFFNRIVDALPSLFYAGFISVGIGYTLQIVGQKKAYPSHAAIIMSLESVFALIGGWLFLSEQFSLKDLLGCLLMFTGMIVSQYMMIRYYFRNRKSVA